jgi:peptidoglycan/xylan/chitin deacetylase (PgdA/CDA1 family)
MLLSHHYFCSERCHRRFILKERVRSFFNPVRDTLKPFWQLLLPWLMEKAGIKKRRGASQALVWQDLLISIVAVLLLASPLIGVGFLLRQNWQLQERLAQLEHLWKTAPLLAKNSASPSPVNNAFFKLDKPAQAMVTGNQLVIEGEALDGQIISLVQGKWVRAVTLPKGGKFTLPPAMLAPGQNQFVVQALDHEGKTIALEHLTISYGRPTINYLTTDLTRGSLERRQVSLTFDGGSTDNAANEILDILRQHQLQVTIFLTGGFIRKFPEVTRRIVQDGHEVGNHTWSHPHLTSFATTKRNETLPNVTREFVHDELNRTARLFEEVTRAKMAAFWRAPFGEHNAEIRQWAAELGYRHIGWTRGRSWQESMDTLDWVSDTSSVAYHTSEEILANLMTMTENENHGINGGIILMHLGSHRQEGDHVYKTLPRLISGLRDKNYELVKVSDLME